MVKEKETPKEESCPQHVIDERKVEEAIERMRDQRQWDMYMMKLGIGAVLDELFTLD